MFYRWKFAFCACKWVRYADGIVISSVDSFFELLYVDLLTPLVGNNPKDGLMRRKHKRSVCWMCALCFNPFKNVCIYAILPEANYFGAQDADVFFWKVFFLLRPFGFISFKISPAENAYIQSPYYTCLDCTKPNRRKALSVSNQLKNSLDE